MIKKKKKVVKPRVVHDLDRGFSGLSCEVWVYSTCHRLSIKKI